MALKYVRDITPEKLLAMRDPDSDFKFDSPFLRYEMEKFYLRNEKLKNVLDSEKKK
jgi:hypothetical protein